MISLAELAVYCQLMSGAAEATPPERELWAQLATEINDYLSPPSDEPYLFGTPTKETR